MTVRAWIIAAVRTGVQRAVTIAVGAAVAWLAMKGFEFEFDPDNIGLLGAIDIAATGVIAGLLVKAEKRLPFLSKYLSLGVSQVSASYQPPPFIETTEPE